MAGQLQESARWDRWRANRFLRVMSGVAAAVGIGFILSPWDAQLRGFLATEVFTGTLNSLAVGATVFGISAAIDGFAAAAVWAGMRLNPNFVDRLRTALKKIEPPESTKLRFSKQPRKRKQQKPGLADKLSQKRVGKVLLTGLESVKNLSASLAVGAGFTLIFSPPERQQDQRAWQDLRKQAAGFTVFNGLFFGSIGWLGANRAIALLNQGSRGFADFIVQWAPDWRPWTVLTVASLTLPWVGYGINQALAKAGFGDIQDKVQPDSQNERRLPVHIKVPVPDAKAALEAIERSNANHRLKEEQNLTEQNKAQAAKEPFSKEHPQPGDRTQTESGQPNQASPHGRPVQKNRWPKPPAQ